MKKWLFSLLVFVFISQYSFAQNNLEVKSSGTNLFIEHIVSPKESLYSLGRQYNVSPKELASYNKLLITTGLNIGQRVKIPLEKTNFSQTDIVNGDDVLVPLYHTMQNKETLYGLSQLYNKVPIEGLKKWNLLQSDAIGAGTPLIIGFLKVDKKQSSLADQGFVPDKKAVQKSTEETAKIEPVIVEVSTEKKVVIPAAQKKEKESIAPVPVVSEEKMLVVKPVNQPRIGFDGGIFKESFEKQNKENAELNTSAATGGIFKSTSGWQDGKYYCFNNEATAGTVLKITDKESGKSIYAKVLDVIPDIKQNSGLQIIISNAAADELGVGEKFECSILQ
ncbi:MAG: LysM peptidoglycan-binding domain-containing protein [Ginsengibacter sp.]